MTNTIKCPNCGKPIEITEALKQQVEAEVITNINKKHHSELLEAVRLTEVRTKKMLEDKQGLEFADLKKQLEEKEKSK